MKKLFLLFATASSIVACNNNQSTTTMDESITTVSRIDDHYSNTIKQDILEAYAKNDFTKFDELVSDSAKVYFNTTTPINKQEWKELAQSHHVYFDSIRWDKNSLYVKTDSLIKDEKHENTTLKAGNIYTLVWYTWEATGKTTHARIINPGSITFQWVNNKITAARFSFDPTPLVNEIAATNNTKK
jgi:hypothetical protein